MKRVLISGAVLALAIGATGVASAEKPSGFKVTGGGQIVTDGSGGGAGDTVGFNAQEIAGDRDDAARGQFQYVPRGESTNESAPAEKSHGVVTCLLSGGEAMANEEAEEDGEYNEALTEGSARFGGHLRDDPATFFTVDVTDNGQGGNAEDDLILVRITAEPCADNPEDEEEDAEDLLRLGRGNVKIHNNPDGTAGTAATATTSTALPRTAR